MSNLRQVKFYDVTWKFPYENYIRKLHKAMFEQVAQLWYQIFAISYASSLWKYSKPISPILIDILSRWNWIANIIERKVFRLTLPKLIFK